MNHDDTNGNAVIPCSGCKRGFPPDKMGRMARLPLVLGGLFHLTPGDEGERLYCPRCRSSQNFGMITLATLGLGVLAGQWRPMAMGVIMLAWLAGTFLWLLFCMCRALHRAITGKPIGRGKTL